MSEVLEKVKPAGDHGEYMSLSISISIGMCMSLYPRFRDDRLDSTRLDS
jgi:hypothetical protein